jgi:3-oxoacyl-[acyl-carrier protein] reductase
MLDGKVALITGASRGIGRGIAELLASEGARVALNYAGDDDAAREALDRVQRAGVEGRSYRADVADVEAIRRLFVEVERDFGGLDIFVANAGRGAIKPLVDITEDDFERVFSLNVRGTFFCLQEAARRVRAGGRIVVISSAITRIRGSGTSLYAASKSAVECFASALSKELGARGVTVNAVSPGYTEAGGLERVPAEFRERGKAASPLGRLGTPNDIAQVVAFLAGPHGGWITGENICVTGGAA